MVTIPKDGTETIMVTANIPQDAPSGMRASSAFIATSQADSNKFATVRANVTASMVSNAAVGIATSDIPSEGWWISPESQSQFRSQFGTMQVNKMHSRSVLMKLGSLDGILSCCPHQMSLLALNTVPEFSLNLRLQIRLRQMIPDPLLRHTSSPLNLE